eukprot:gene3668-4093_t
MKARPWARPPALTILCAALSCVPRATTAPRGPGGYTAAVLQHTVVYAGGADRAPTPASARDTRLANVAAFDVAAGQAKARGAQIIVFPELGLGVNEESRYYNAMFGEPIPDPADTPGANPCAEAGKYNASAPALVAASCMARRHGIVAVVGCTDAQPCSGDGCPPGGSHVYNAAVAFGESGAVLAKYHKYHIFFSLTKVFDVPAQPQLRTFATSFGVTFGVFICFDLMFYYPAAELVAIGVRDFAFPTDWTNVPPIVTANQAQQAFSRLFGSNLLAANNGLSASVSGSGVYAAGQPLSFYFNASASGAQGNRLLVAEVPPQQAAGPHPTRTPPTTVAVTPAGPPSPDHGHLCGPEPGTGRCVYFEASPGKAGNASVSARNVTCSVQYEFAGSSGGGRYALWADDSLVYFSQWVNATACGVVHCVQGEAACVATDPLARGVYRTDAVFSRLALASDLGDRENVYPLVAVDGGQVLSKDRLSHVPGSGALSIVGGDAAVIEATLLVGSWRTNITYST